MWSNWVFSSPGLAAQHLTQTLNPFQINNNDNKNNKERMDCGGGGEERE